MLMSSYRQFSTSVLIREVGSPATMVSLAEEFQEQLTLEFM